MNKIPKLIKRSIHYAFTFIGGLSTIAGLWGYTVKDINEDLSWWKWGIILCGVFIVLSFGIYVFLRRSGHKAYSTVINGKPVVIKIGDIFEESGWKVIPCNERFDTEVDDHIIAHNTLNGKMIDNHVDDVEKLKETINNAANDSSKFKPSLINGKTIYPLICMQKLITRKAQLQICGLQIKFKRLQIESEKLKRIEFFHRQRKHRST